ncbi:MAG: hypothetical protein WB785_05890 [Mycobacterium sp.]|uniref:hypothetical protein n=1 Tax=Mycobacterium sp. TaxID=1785 RepID=UPI003C454FAC
MGTAPVVGGALLGAAAGQLKAPDYRALIKQDMDLLDRLPPEATARRAAVQRTIDARIDDLVAATEKSRALRAAAASYKGNWRDIVLFLCTVLFTVVWWNIKHSRTDWLPVFIALILLSILAAAYALRGVLRAAATFVSRGRRQRAENSQSR